MPGSGLPAIADVTRVTTTAEFTLGTTHMQDATTYRYVKASAAIAAGDFLRVDNADADEPYALRPTSAVNQPIAGVATVAIASGSYGWVAICGKATAKVAASTAAGSQIGSSGTAGTGSAITISATPTQAEIQRVVAAAAGIGVETLSNEASGTAPVNLAP